MICKTAARQDITKVVNCFYKIGVSFQHSLLNKKVDKYIKSEILRRYSSSVMVKKFILQLYRTTTFLSQGGGGGGGLGVYQKMLIKKIIQLILLKMPRNNKKGLCRVKSQSLQIFQLTGDMIFGVLIFVDR